MNYFIKILKNRADTDFKNKSDINWFKPHDKQSLKTGKGRWCSYQNTWQSTGILSYIENGIETWIISYKN